MTETATTSTLESAPRMPFPRSNVLEISPIYGLLRNEAPVVKVETPTGDPAWLVVAHHEAREVFADRRFGYYTHANPDAASKLTDAATHSQPMGNVEFEAEMLRLRRLLVPGFAPKRMRLLAGWIQELTDQCLNDMERVHDANPDEPVNYHDLLGWRLPVLVIGALLGVPDEDRAAVIDLSDRMGNIGDHADGVAARAQLNEYMSRLVAVKRNNPGPDVISDMIAAEAEDPAFFSERPLEAYAAGLVFPGHETTVARLDFGILWLLSDTRRRDWLLADPEGRIEQTVEEILRTTSAHNLGLMRYALEDVEIGGVTVRRGDLVIISEGAANRDPSVWPEPDRFDPERPSHGHLAFGHGAHVCIGQSLARTELRTVFPSLFRRFPEVRLAADVSTLRIRNDRTGGGIDDVRLTW
jgi:cytochrome P450